MIRFFCGDSLWHGRPARDLCTSTGGTPMSQCDPGGSRGFHRIKGSKLPRSLEMPRRTRGSVLGARPYRAKRSQSHEANISHHVEPWLSASPWQRESTNSPYQEQIRTKWFLDATRTAGFLRKFY
jgi:hypothetical protein